MLNIILLIGFLLMIINLPLVYIVNYYYISKVKDEYDRGRYVAVVLTNKSWADKFIIYTSGIMFLVMYLKKNKISYKLMKKFDRQKFNDFINDTNCYGLYILGHGTRHSLTIGKGTKEEILEYREFKGFNGSPKDFVVQLHCNHDGGESLADIIAPNKSSSYVSDSYRLADENMIHFIYLYQPSPNMLAILVPLILLSVVSINLAKVGFVYLTFLRYFCNHILDIKKKLLKI
jgi:hypothetical protein